VAIVIISAILAVIVIIIGAILAVIVIGGALLVAAGGWKYRRAVRATKPASGTSSDPKDIRVIAAGAQAYRHLTHIDFLGSFC
jgi:uncharacterized membrane protein